MHTKLNMQVIGNKCCPNCGQRVSWWRLLFVQTIWSKWKCKECNVLLGYSVVRRIVGALISLIMPFTLLIVFIEEIFSNFYLLIPVFAISVCFAHLADGIEIKELNKLK